MNEKEGWEYLDWALCYLPLSVAAIFILWVAYVLMFGSKSLPEKHLSIPAAHAASFIVSILWSTGW